MPVRKVESEVEYTASDGRSFESEAEAERHEKLISVRDDYRSARMIYARRLAETFKTADGYRFDITTWHYYRVTPWFHRMPGVQEVSIWSPDFDIDEHDPVEGEFVCELHGHDGKKERQRIRISDLYRRRAAADRACLEAQKKRLAEITGDVEAFAAKISRKTDA